MSKQFPHNTTVPDDDETDAVGKLLGAATEMVHPVWTEIREMRARPTVHEIAKGLLEASIADHALPSMEQGELCDWAYAFAQALYDRGTQWEKEQGDGWDG